MHHLILFISIFLITIGCVKKKSDLVFESSYTKKKAKNPFDFKNINNEATLDDPLQPDTKEFIAFKQVVFQLNSCMNCHGPGAGIDFSLLRTQDQWLNSPYVVAGKPELSTVYAFIKGIGLHVPGKTLNIMPPSGIGPTPPERQIIKTWIESTGAGSYKGKIIDEDFEDFTGTLTSSLIGRTTVVTDISKVLKLTFANSLGSKAFETVVPVSFSSSHNLKYSVKNLTGRPLTLKILEDKKTSILATHQIEATAEWQNKELNFSSDGFTFKDGKVWTKISIEWDAQVAGKEVLLDNIVLTGAP